MNNPSSAPLAMTRYVDRSRIISYQRCHRQRYWQYEYQGKGVVPKALSIPLTTGTHVHGGAEHLLRVAMEHSSPMGGDIEDAVAIGLEGYWRDVTARGFDLEENEVAAEVAKEQAALTEVLIRLFGMRVLPWLLEDGYEILGVEQECEWEIAPGLVMMGRPDAVMLHKPTEDIHLLSLKTKKNWDSRADKANSHDDQGISEAVCYEASYPGEKVQAVVMPTLLKGNRRKDEKTKQYTQNCPLIHGWRQENRGQTGYAHSYQWKDEFGTRKLAMNGGSKWESFRAWEQPGGVKWWMDLLATGTIQPEAGDPLAQSVMIPTPYYRQEADIIHWKRQIASQEKKIADSMEKVSISKNEDELSLILDEDFNQEKVSCHYPGDCSYLDLCYGPPQLAEDPLATERFMYRIPHHEAELVQITEAE